MLFFCHIDFICYSVLILVFVCFSRESFGEGGAGSKHQVGGEGGGEDLGRIVGGEKYDQNMMDEKFPRKVKRNIYGEFFRQTSGKTHSG